MGDEKEMEKEKTPSEIRLECVSGMSFVMFGFGVICLTPGTLAFAVFGMDGSGSAVQIVVATFYAIVMLITFIGFLGTIYWCCRTKYALCGGMKSPSDGGKAERGSSTPEATFKVANSKTVY